jgi:nicotinate-nucleotide adenylyltransferase
MGRPSDQTSLHLSYGGTFDPVHNGHIAVARSAAQQFDEIVHLVPCADPPHRAAPQASADQRAQMLRLALMQEPTLALDLREIQRGGASFTIDTLVELRAEFGPQRPIACLIGADALHGLPSWRDWRRVFELAHVIGLTRPGHDLDALPEELARQWTTRRVGQPKDLRAAAAGRVIELVVPSWEVSSTAVRAALAVGRAPSQAMPAAVLEWILKHGLYRSPDAPSD